MDPGPASGAAPAPAPGEWIIGIGFVDAAVLLLVATAWAIARLPW